MSSEPVFFTFLAICVVVCVVRSISRRREKDRQFHAQMNIDIETLLQRLATEAIGIEAARAAQRQALAPHWRTLGINPTRDKEKITQAFKKAALKVHPDMGGSNAAFLKLYEARNKALKECA